MSFNCCDAVTHQCVVILPDRLSKHIIDYFESHFSLTEQATVQSVVVDMNAAYASFIHQLFPNSVVIIDRFHIIQLAGRALDKERVHLAQEMSDSHSRIHRILKSQWKLFRLKKADLNATKVSYLFGINEYMTQQNAVDLALVKSPKFKIVYETYQEILAAVHTKDSVKINDLMNHYQPTLTEMDTVLKTLKKNRSAICLYPFSNGPLEE